MDIYAIGFEYNKHNNNSCWIRLCKIVRAGNTLIWKCTLRGEMYNLMSKQLLNNWYTSSRAPGEGDMEAAAKVARAMGLPFIGEIENGAKPYCEGDL